MAQFDTFEGTWEEIVETQAARLAGKRVRVIVLPERGPQQLDLALENLLAEVDRLEVKRPGLSYHKPDPFGDELSEKYGKQGFKL
ncbi:MAG: hypothetical protein J0I20_07260 [Chloroflexi bacterium]|nr:hypothetical protein [Chloroflexota bacterium]OJV95223.1 MAG: hypothetical protein BGO39_24765 [Chloroflexi bacterium 54-19]